jgi:hydrogenase/urease accessory protein HupE
MLRTLTLAAALFAPASAFAHNDGHTEMSLVSEFGHMISDPAHLGLLVAVTFIGIAIWKGLRGTPAQGKVKTVKIRRD